MTFDRVEIDVSGRMVAGREYRLEVNAALDGLVLTDATEQRIAYLAQDNSWCVIEGRQMDLRVRRRRFGWELALRDSGSEDLIAVSRPKLRPNAYRIDGGSSRRLRVSRGLVSGTWSLASDRGRLARIRVHELALSPRSPLWDSPAGRSAAEITLLDRPASIRDVGPIVLLAMATIRAQLSIPTPDIPAAF